MSGADILITASYQASVESFKKFAGLDPPQTLALIEESVGLARKAASVTNSE